LGSKVGQSLELSPGIPVLDGDRLTLDVAQLSQSLAERLIPRGVHAGAARCENSNARNFPYLLRLAAARRGEHGSEASDEGATVHLFAMAVWPGKIGSQRITTRERFGTASLSSSRYLPPAIGATVTPVMFPPGRARLVISPASTGAPPRSITIGIEPVACLAATVSWFVRVTITSTFSRTRSTASAGSRSVWPSANRGSKTMFWLRSSRDLSAT